MDRDYPPEGRRLYSRSSRAASVSQPRPAWVWGSPFAVPSSNRTRAKSRRPSAPAGAQFSPSRCPWGLRRGLPMAEPLPVAILIEDERQIRRFLRTALETEGWMVHEAETMRQGLTDAGTRRPDLIILDLGLPDGDGVEFLHDLRGWSKVPVIVLSARVSEQDKIAALDAGADDYLTKPFSVGELLARVRATSRRRQDAGVDPGAVFEFGDVKIDLS